MYATWLFSHRFPDSLISALLGGTRLNQRASARQRQMAKKKKTSSGGKAEASGGNYETLVATWYAHSVLLGGIAQPPFDLHTDTQIVSFTCQSDAPVDDVNAK